MNGYMPARMRQLMPLADGLAAAARETAKAARKIYKTRPRQRRGATLRPGPSTPLWNELARAVELQLTRYGHKAKLARLLGVSRQRVHLYVVAKTACPDAERTLALLNWLNARRAGRDPA